MEDYVQDQLDNMRQKRRESFHSNRLKRRSDAFNARRTNMEDFTNKLQVPTLSEMHKLTEEFIKGKKINILHRVRLGLSMGEEYISVFLEVPSSLYTVIGCFTGKNAELQLEAGFTIVNLGLGTEDQSYLVAGKLGAYLITMMTSGSPILQDVSAWSYGNLCGGNYKVCCLAECQGIEMSLIKLLSSYSCDVLQSTTYALFQYFTTVPNNIEQLMTTEVVKMLVESLERSNTAVVEVSWFIFFLSTYKNICQKLVDHGVIQVSFNALHQIINKQALNVAAATALIRIISNCIAAVPPIAVEVCYRSDQLVSICSGLLYSPHPHHRTETLQMIANLFNTLNTSDTGRHLLDDNNLKARLKSAIQSSLASNFELSA